MVRLRVDDDQKMSYECEWCKLEFGDALPNLRDAKAREHFKKIHPFEVEMTRPIESDEP